MTDNVILLVEDNSSDEELTLRALRKSNIMNRVVVARDGDDGLMLDIAGVAHLFGGEAVLATDIVARLHAQGFAASAAIADTPGAAFAAARYGGPQVVAPDGQAATCCSI